MRNWILHKVQVIFNLYLRCAQFEVDKRLFNSSYPYISVHILYTIPYTFPKVLTRRISLEIKSLFC